LEGALTEGPGDRIGHYKLLEQIGEGGCGVVYMAEQTEPIRRRVALKIVKLGMDTKQVIARFEAERQALALMDHPNIAKVLDAGATETGRPYFVMELVRGVRITDYCDQNQLPTQERLDLFMQVCHAVQHAHQKGIIHRDLKPSNILVTLHDGAPAPKVIDFGIAKATQPPLTDKTRVTSFQQFVGTPAYMSPEQAGMSGLDIDTRSDIYSLGVLLYELLTGRLPFELKELAQAGLDEMRCLIRQQDPPKPSTRLSTLAGAELSTTARQRQIEPPKLLKLVRGDLDWIVLKCLEKDRARRYGTANGLVDDLMRHLHDEPITARQPGPLYRFKKMVRRNKLAFAATGTVALALVIGLGFSTWMFLREKHARFLAEARAYASDMSLASRTADLQTGLGSVAQLVSIWRDYRPDLRGWEWHYLDGLCRQELVTLPANSNGLRSVAWSPDGRLLATAGADGIVKLWDALAGREVATLYGHTGGVTSVSWSPDGKQVATASKDQTIKLWDALTSTKVGTLLGHTSEVNSVSWSPIGDKLASAGADRMIRIWDLASRKQIRETYTRSRIQTLCWSHNGERLAAAGTSGFLKLWDGATGRELLDFGTNTGMGWRAAVAWSPDDKRLATGGDDFVVRVWDAATGTNTTADSRKAVSLNAGWKER